VVAGYPLLQAAGARLVAAGVPFHDLTAVFRDHPEPLYVDTCCHVGHEGSRLLAVHLAGLLRRQLDRAAGDVTAIEVVPLRLELASPLQIERIVVRGRTATGVELDVTAAALGTRLAAGDPRQVHVGVDGAVRARRRGTGSVQVRHGAWQHEVQVVADWPDVVVAGDGVAGSDGVVPQLELVSPWRADERVARVRCTGLPVGAFRLLVTAAEPLPGQLPEDPAAIAALGGQPLDATAVAPTAEVSLPPVVDQPLFLRAVALAADGKGLAAASPTLVLTRR
jgi:hypothetical protein